MACSSVGKVACSLPNQALFEIMAQSSFNYKCPSLTYIEANVKPKNESSVIVVLCCLGYHQ